MGQSFVAQVAGCRRFRDWRFLWTWLSLYGLRKFVLFVKFVDKILVHKWHKWTRMVLPTEGRAAEYPGQDFSLSVSFRVFRG
jgi:hypothetical protein